jgi:hypothetical protein
MVLTLAKQSGTLWKPMQWCIPGYSSDQIKQPWYGRLREKNMADQQDLDLELSVPRKRQGFEKHSISYDCFSEDQEGKPESMFMTPGPEFLQDEPEAARPN